MPKESKARWDGVGGDEGYGNKIIGTGPLKFVERIEGSTSAMRRWTNTGEWCPNTMSWSFAG